jgi:hypothetical protein
MQLALFEGPHLPRNAARQALSRGALDEACAELARRGGAVEEAADAARLERIRSALRTAGGDAAAAVHEAFASALAGPEPAGFLADAEWFALYAQRLAGALDAEPGRGFRGWLGAHFAFAAGDRDATRRAASRIVESLAPGPAWIEAARLAYDFGDAAGASGWIHAACLDSPDALAAAAPALQPCDLPALDAAPRLPPLPPAVEDLFDAVRALEDLPGPMSRWVAVVGEIDRVLVPRGPDEAEPIDGASASVADPARAFLAALRAARRSRERDRPRGPEHCSDRELRARRRMQRLAAPLLARYLESLRGALF